MKHYHVLAGLHGCLCDINDIYLTKNEAKNGLSFWVMEWKNQGEKVTGNQRDEYLEIGDNSYIEISPCFEKDCVTCQTCGNKLDQDSINDESLTCVNCL